MRVGLRVRNKQRRLFPRLHGFISILIEKIRILQTLSLLTVLLGVLTLHFYLYQL